MESRSRIVCDYPALTVIRAVRDQVLVDESRWTKGQFAQDVDGESISSTANGAVKFCLLGACRRAAVLTKGGYAASIGAEECLGGNVPRFTGQYITVVSFNDNIDTTFQDIKNFLNFVLGEETDGGKTESSEAST